MDVNLLKLSVMTIQEILFKGSQNDIIEELKKRNSTAPDIKKYLKQLNIDDHDINDATLRPDKIVKVTDASGDVTGTRPEKVARIALSLQKLIVNRAAAFAFGNAPDITTETTDENEQKVYKACLKILTDNKSVSHNKNMAKSCMKFTESAELWFPRPGKHNNYGFDSEFKIKVRIFSADKGDSLYPLFDEYGDMIAFSREFKAKENGKEIEYFETYTSDYILKWKKENAEWTEVFGKDGKRVQNMLGKIPVVYISQPEAEWSDVQNLINELELLLSRFSDTVAYHGSPKIFVTGDILGFAKKGEEGAIISGGKDATANYLAWPYAPDAVKLEKETLLNLIFTITQTPDISFDSLKGIGQIAYNTLKLMFLDAHLKVEDKKEIYIEMLQRRMNILKAFVGKLDNKLSAASSNLDLSVDIVPYMPGDLASDIQNLTNATAGKAILSQKTAVAKSGLVKDAEKEYKLIQEEDSASNIQDIFNPTK